MMLSIIGNIAIYYIPTMKFFFSCITDMHLHDKDLDCMEKDST